MEFKPNKYQEAIYDFILHGEGNAVINAVAGSGKSTTLVNALNIIDPNKSVLFLAFNKSIVDELKKKVGVKPNIQIRTLHSLGSSVCYNTFHSTINADKYFKHISQSIKEGAFKPSKRLTREEMSQWSKNIKTLCELGRIELATDNQSLMEVANRHDILIEDNEIELALKAIRWGCINVAEIDFTDMIYFPNVKKMDIPVFDFVFVDECQDLNAAQREFFLKCVDPDDGRFVCVGDRNQAIYAFNGADAESFSKLTKIPNTTMLPLSVCYRCSKKIVESAQRLVPQIEYKSDAEDGTINFKAKIEDVEDGDMIVCRVSAPLVKLCMRFIKEGRKAYIKGGDIGKNLISIIKNTGKDNVDDMILELSKESVRILEKICKLNGYDMEDASQTSAYQTFLDKIEAIEAISEGFNKTEDLIKKISDIFRDDNGKGICLSTVHKAKGLENDRVFILDKNRFYPRWAMKNEVQVGQEKNIEYVAITRPKKYLGYIYYTEKETEDSSNGIF